MYNLTNLYIAEKSKLGSSLARRIIRKTGSFPIQLVAEKNAIKGVEFLN